MWLGYWYYIGSPTVEVDKKSALFSVKVKRDGSDRPNPADGTTLTRLVAQFADMARLHLAARPFMRYSVHLTVLQPC